jgi:hypothetical protein
MMAVQALADTSNVVIIDRGDRIYREFFKKSSVAS